MCRNGLPIGETISVPDSLANFAAGATIATLVITEAGFYRVRVHITCIVVAPATKPVSDTNAKLLRSGRGTAPFAPLPTTATGVEVPVQELWMECLAGEKLTVVGAAADTADYIVDVFAADKMDNCRR